MALNSIKLNICKSYYIWIMDYRRKSYQYILKIKIAEEHIVCEIKKDNQKPKESNVLLKTKKFSNKIRCAWKS
jgi:hypothetical protein